MSNGSENIIEDKEVLEQAAEYYLALQENSMSGAELRAWQSWFLRSQKHQEAFQRLEALWGVLDGLSIEDFEVDQRVEQDVPVGSASGSVLSLITPESEPLAVRRPIVVWAQAIAACLAIMVITAYMVVDPETGASQQRVDVYETAAAMQRVITLSDGSILELGTDSEVAVGYTAASRELTLLRGQAVFTVSKNPNRPFVVKAGQGSVTAIGTVFNVRKSGAGVEVRVLEGTVAVRPILEQEAVASSVALVTAGLQTHYSDEGILEPIEAADVREGLEWRTGVLTMVNRQLGDVIQELNRFVENEITIGDEAVGRFNFTGTVYPDQIDDWLAGLQQGYPLKVMRVGSSTVLMLDEKDSAGSSPS